MSTLNLLQINLMTLQPNLCGGLPKYSTANPYEKLFSLCNGVSSFTASNFLVTTSKKYFGYPLCINIVGKIKVYVRKLFKLKNDGKKEYLCLLSICTANLNEMNNMNHI